MFNCHPGASINFQCYYCKCCSGYMHSGTRWLLCVFSVHVPWYRSMILVKAKLFLVIISMYYILFCNDYIGLEWKCGWFTVNALLLFDFFIMMIRWTVLMFSLVYESILCLQQIWGMFINISLNTPLFRWNVDLLLSK